MRRCLRALWWLDPETLEPVPRDGQTMGEVMMHNNVMKGYLKTQLPPTKPSPVAGFILET